LTFFNEVPRFKSHGEARREFFQSDPGTSLRGVWTGSEPALVTERNRLLWRNTDPVTDLLRRGVLVTDGAEHDHYRELMEAPLHPSRLPNYTQMMIQQTDRVSSMWRDGEVVDMLVEGRKIALLIIMQTLFTKDAWDDLPHIWDPILKAIKFISPGCGYSAKPAQHKKALKELDDYLYRIIADRKLGTFQQDLLQHLVDAGLTDDVIRDQMLTMLIAGQTSTFWHGRLPCWDSITRPCPILQEIDTLDKSSLLDQIIKESLRLYPPIHIGNRRVAEEMDFSDGSVPAGGRMFYSIYLTHRDPAIWENAEDFCPERFARGRKTPPFSYVPFGGGPRSCIGAAFGQARRVVMPAP
jgi:cytochrome P450